MTNNGAQITGLSTCIAVWHMFVLICYAFVHKHNDYMDKVIVYIYIYIYKSLYDS